MITGSTQDILIHDQPSNSPEGWTHVQVHYSASNIHQLILLGQYGNGPKGFLAVDDVRIIEGDCDQQSTPYPTPTPTRNVYNISLSINYHFCVFSNQKSVMYF